MATRVFLETPRLILRTVTIEDVDQVAAAWKLDDGPISQEEAGEKIRWMESNHARSRHGRITHLCLAVVEKKTGDMIGWCGLDHREEERQAPALFYLLRRNCWGRGCATEAAGALIRYAFEVLCLPRIDGGAARENTASKRVMEKIGMRFLGQDETGGYAFTLSREVYQEQAAERDHPSRLPPPAS